MEHRYAVAKAEVCQLYVSIRKNMDLAIRVNSENSEIRKTK